MEKTFEDDNTYPLFNNCTWRMPMLKYRNIYLFFTKKKLVLTNHRLYNWLTVTLQSFSGWDTCCLVVTIFRSVPSFVRIYLLFIVYSSIPGFNPRIPSAHRSIENGTVHSGSQLSMNVHTEQFKEQKEDNWRIRTPRNLCLSAWICNQESARNVKTVMTVWYPQHYHAHERSKHLSGWQDI